MRRLAGVIQPHETINMDASDLGVCAVWHSQKLYFAIEWNDEEKALIQSFKNKDNMSFSINYRELLRGLLCHIHMEQSLEPHLRQGMSLGTA